MRSGETGASIRVGEQSWSGKKYFDHSICSFIVFVEFVNIGIEIRELLLGRVENGARLDVHF